MFCLLLNSNNLSEIFYIISSCVLKNLLHFIQLIIFQYIFKLHQIW